MIEGNYWGKIIETNGWQGKPKYSKKTYPSAALFTADPK
jgi:hypothetical protein